MNLRNLLDILLAYFQIPSRSSNSLLIKLLVYYRMVHSVHNFLVGDDLQEIKERDKSSLVMHASGHSEWSLNSTILICSCNLHCTKYGKRNF